MAEMAWVIGSPNYCEMSPLAGRILLWKKTSSLKEIKVVSETRDMHVDVEKWRRSLGNTSNSADLMPLE